MDLPSIHHKCSPRLDPLNRLRTTVLKSIIGFVSSVGLDAEPSHRRALASTRRSITLLSKSTCLHAIELRASCGLHFVTPLTQFGVGVPKPSFSEWVKRPGTRYARTVRETGPSHKPLRETEASHKPLIASLGDLHASALIFAFFGSYPTEPR